MIHEVKSKIDNTHETFIHIKYAIKLWKHS